MDGVGVQSLPYLSIIAQAAIFNAHHDNLTREPRQFENKWIAEDDVDTG